MTTECQMNYTVVLFNTAWYLTGLNMELTMDTSRDRLTKMFFKELGNEFPTEEQKRVVEVFDEGTLTKPIIKRMLDEGKTSGEIAQSLRMKTETIRSKIKRLKKQGAN